MSSGLGQRAVAIQADTADPQAVEAMFTETDRTLGPLTALINNAGIVEKMATAEVDPIRLRRMIDVNVTGYFLCAHHAVRRMGRSYGGRGGTIVNISSRAAASGGLPGSIGYAATKGAVDSMTLGQAKELGPEGVRAVAIRPGLIHSDIHDQNGGRDAVDARWRRRPCLWAVAANLMRSPASRSGFAVTKRAMSAAPCSMSAAGDENELAATGDESIT